MAQLAAAEVMAEIDDNLQQMATDLVFYRNELDRIEAERKEISAKYEELRRRQIPDRLAEFSRTQIRLPSGTLVYLKRDAHLSIKHGTEAELARWLRNNGLAHLTDVLPDIPRLKEWLEEGNDSSNFPNSVTFTEFTAAIKRR
jgi:hypothetical protein